MKEGMEGKNGESVRTEIAVKLLASFTNIFVGSVSIKKGHAQWIYYVGPWVYFNEPLCHDGAGNTESIDR